MFDFYFILTYKLSLIFTANRSSTKDPDSPASNDGSIDVLDQPVCSPTLSLKDETIAQSLPLEEQLVGY